MIWLNLKKVCKINSQILNKSKIRSILKFPLVKGLLQKNEVVKSYLQSQHPNKAIVKNLEALKSHLK